MPQTKKAIEAEYIFNKINKEYECFDVTKLKEPLEESWDKAPTAWVVPPHNSLESYAKKAVEESKYIQILMLLPVTTSEPWWKEYLSKGTILYLQGEVKYKKGKTPKPSAIVMLGKGVPTNQALYVELREVD